MPPRIPLASAARAVAAPARNAVAATRALSAAAARRAEAAAPAEEIVDELNIDKSKVAIDDYTKWLKGPGQNFKKPLFNEMNYICSYDSKTWQRRGTDKDFLNTPFALNPFFKSHPVLSDALKADIYERVVTKGRTVRAVSAESNVSMERVAAVVRLKAVEKEWVDQVRMHARRAPAPAPRLTSAPRPRASTSPRTSRAPCTR